MSKYVRTIYLYLVSLITLCMIVVGIVGMVDSYVAYLKPTTYNYYSYPTYSSDKTFEIYKKEVADHVKASQIKSIKTMFTYVTVLVVSAPLFVFHWQTIEKERKMEV